MMDNKTDVLTWIAQGEVGESSMTMALACVGIKYTGASYPLDPGDFKRCLAMFDECPTLDITKVSELFPWYAPFVDNWQTLKAMYDEESPSGYAPKLYAKMKSLEQEVMILKGYRKSKSGHWRKSA